jgi:ADP-ribose pyrophosphatase
MQFELLQNKKVLETYPFSVEELQILNKRTATETHPFYRLSCPDWVNVLPVTADGHAVLIDQPRVGPFRNVLEIPGGVIDPGERDPTMAAARELEEETGFTSQRILSLGKLNPNPAIMTNNVHMFLALGCIPAVNRKHFPDEFEEIEVKLVPVGELEDMVRHGRIDHALCGLTIMLALKYLNLSPTK